MSTSFYHYLRYSPNADAHHPHAAFTLPPRRPHAACTPPHAASTTTPPPHCVHAATCSPHAAARSSNATSTPPPRRCTLPLFLCTLQQRCLHAAAAHSLPVAARSSNERHYEPSRRCTPPPRRCTPASRIPRAYGEKQGGIMEKEGLYGEKKKGGGGVEKS